MILAYARFKHPIFGFFVTVLVGVLLALAIKIVVFDPNWRVKPVCFNARLDVFVLEGYQTQVFRDAIANPAFGHFMDHGFRLNDDGVYISLLDYDINDLLNHTTKSIGQIERTEMNALVSIDNYIALKKARGEFPPRPSSNVDCELVAAIAIK
ncbi:MAG: hypothetical protein WD044_00010 [Dongiaceae bacterium]